MRRAATRTLDGLLTLYLGLVVWFLLLGPIDTLLPGGIRMHMGDLQNPIIILTVVAMLRVALTICWNRTAIFAIMTICFSVLLPLLAGEAYFRIRYPASFAPPVVTKNPDSTFNQNERGPAVTGPKADGVTRILVQGDSITWGQGVVEWTDVYPARLLTLLNREGRRYDMDTIAEPGWEINQHASNLHSNIDRVDPDIIIYQWYVNDLEVIKSRPSYTDPIWRKLPFHQTLTRWSNLYFFLDQRVGPIFTRQGENYIDYLNNDFDEGTKGWQAFGNDFHWWATMASARADRVIMALYPVVPFKGAYPYERLLERMKVLAGPHDFTLPAHLSPRGTGEEFGDATGSYGQVRRAVSGKHAAGTLVYGPYATFAGGTHTTRFRMRAEGVVDTTEVALIDVVSNEGKTVHASRMLTGADFGLTGEWREFTLAYTLDASLTQGNEFRVIWHGAGTLLVDRIDTPVDYGIEQIDLLPYLTGFDTHATLFDSHPNAEAHRVMADVLYSFINSGVAPPPDSSAGP